MALSHKGDPERAEGLVEEALPGLTFRVRLKDNQEVLGYPAGRLRINHIRILPGDRVLVEVGPDGGRGRIVRLL